MSGVQRFDPREDPRCDPPWRVLELVELVELPRLPANLPCASRRCDFALASPPFFAIWRCFCGSIEAKPRRSPRFAPSRCLLVTIEHLLCRAPRHSSRAFDPGSSNSVAGPFCG